MGSALRTLGAGELDLLAVLAVHGAVVPAAVLDSAMAVLQPDVSASAVLGRPIDLGLVVGGPA